MDIHAIGELAGKLWRHLAQNGEVPLGDLPKGVQADPAAVHMALGWLGREDKLVLERKGKSVMVHLKESAAIDSRS